MKIEELDSGSDTALIRLSSAELVLLNNALNEICHGVKIPAFETRLGSSKEVAKSLLRQVGDAVNKLDDLNLERERTQIIANSPKGEAYLRKIKRNE